VPVCGALEVVRLADEGARAAIWSTESAEVYRIGFPVRKCSGPRSSMICVPLAGKLPRNVTFASRSIADTNSGGKCSNSPNGSSSITPANSQCPVVLSFPADRSHIIP
jgi:hypothetical protein